MCHWNKVVANNSKHMFCNAGSKTKSIITKLLWVAEMVHKEQCTDLSSWSLSQEQIFHIL